MQWIGRTAFVFAVLAVLAAPATGDKLGANRDTYLLELEEIDKVLLKKKWKPALKRAEKLAATIVKHSWYVKKLDEVLAEVAFQQAVARVNLGERYEGVFYYLIAQNLDFRIRSKDLAPYAEANIFREYPLRQLGEVPQGFVTRPHSGEGTRGPVVPKLKEQRILTNTGAAASRLGDFLVELILDEEGRVHHPVVISEQQHPIVRYFVLEGLVELPKFEPALYLGDPVDCVFDLTMQFKLIRW